MKFEEFQRTRGQRVSEGGRDKGEHWEPGTGKGSAGEVEALLTCHAAGSGRGGEGSAGGVETSDSERRGGRWRPVGKRNERRRTGGVERVAPRGVGTLSWYGPAHEIGLFPEFASLTVGCKLDGSDA